MTTDTLPVAIRRRRFLGTAWPWRALAYLATTVPVSAVLSIGLFLLVSPLLKVISDVSNKRPVELPIVVFLTFVALMVLAIAPIAVVPVTVIERFRLGLIDRRPLPPRRWPGLVARYRTPATWMEVGHALWVAGLVPILYGIWGVLAIVASSLVAGPFLVGDSEQISVLGATVDNVGQAIPSQCWACC
ncbi:sensor domain-containing protein [Paractinoplanes durhamensis]|uniref:sensor domain-containing protein n=1 Tax=Paractinoplanes durhamensis TaxID=113563 RepID=UPI00362EFA09